MSTIDQAKVAGQLRDIKRKLDLVGRRFAASNLRRSLRKSANVMRDEARSIVSVDTGALKRAIVTETNVAKDRRSVIAAVSIKKGAFRVVRSAGGDVEFLIPRRTVHFVEFGSAHQAAAPFMRPAFDNKHRDAFEVFTRDQRVSLDRKLA